MAAFSSEDPSFIEFAPVVIVAPIGLQALTFPLLPRECVHTLENFVPLCLRAGHSGADLFESGQGVFVLSAWSLGLMISLSAWSTASGSLPSSFPSSDNADLCFDATLQGASTGVIQRGIAERFPLTYPERSPYPGLGAAAAASNLKELLKLRFCRLIFEPDDYSNSSAMLFRIGRRSVFEWSTVYRQDRT